MTEPPQTIDPMLLQAALRVGAGLDLDVVLAAVLEQFVAVAAAQRAAVALVGHTSPAVLLASWDTDDPTDHETPTLCSGVIDEVVRTGTRVVISDAVADARFRVRASVRNLRLRLLVGQPVHADGRLIGVLYADSTTGASTAWKPRFDLLEGLSQIAGLALHNARQQYALRFRTRVLGHIALELRAPLAAVAASAHHLDEEEATDTDSGRVARDILRNTRAMSRLIGAALELSRPDGSPVDLAPIDLTHAVERAVAGWSERAEALDVGLRLEPGPDGAIVLSRTDTLDVALDTALHHALTTTAGGTAVDVSISLTPTPAPPGAWGQGLAVALGLAQDTPLVPHPECDWYRIEIHHRGKPMHARVDASMLGSAAGTGNPELRFQIVSLCLQVLGGDAWVLDGPEGRILGMSVPSRLVASVAREVGGA